MSQSVDANSTIQKIRLTKEEVSAIWPGLDYIFCQFLTWKRTGESLTSYPFRIQPLPPGYDTGTFSTRMIDRIRNLWSKIKSIETNGGVISLDEFELRAAAYSARTSVKLTRYEIGKPSQRGVDAKKRAAGFRRSLKKQELRKDHIIQFLEIAMKRAKRRFKAAAGAQEYGLQCKEWRSHFRWSQYHLTYFKPFRPLKVSVSQMRRTWVDRLVQMAEKAIVGQGYELPDPVKLRRVIRQFLRYSRRGRMGEYHYLYMLKNTKRSEARLKLFEFVQARILLKEAA